MRAYLKHVGLKLRYNPTPGIVLDSLSKLGLEIAPYLLFREGETAPSPPEPEGVSDYSVELLDADDMPSLAAFPARQPSLADLLQRLEHGMWCLGLKHRGEVVGFVWCDLDACHYPGCRFDLLAEEAYLFDQFTLMAYRGKRIAPFLRARSYQVLRERNRPRLFSVSNRYNTNANRFKQRLGARVVHRGVYLNALGRWGWSSALSEAALSRIRTG